MGVTLKVLRRGTHRSASLDDTLKRALPLAPVMGITRVANVTGLDSVGIPVVMVCRPNSRSVAVSQGKGIDLASARASGLMEAVELYHAETITLPLRLATYEELRYQHNVVEVDDLPRAFESRFHPFLRLLWCEGSDLLSGESLLVPYEMVHTNYAVPLPDGHGCFAASSNGLASGNTLIVAIWDITTDIKIAAFNCLIMPWNEGMWHCAAAAGYGCHPARQIALLRALTEAAQTRLTVISGLRDDFRGDTYEQLQDLEVVRAIRDHITASRATRRFSDVPNWDADTFEDDVEWELKCLRQAGVRRVVAVDLTKPEFDVPVVRIIIPGLEAMLESGYVLSAAARSAIAGRP